MTLIPTIFCLYFAFKSNTNIMKWLAGFILIVTLSATTSLNAQSSNTLKQVQITAQTSETDLAAIIADLETKEIEMNVTNKQWSSEDELTIIEGDIAIRGGHKTPFNVKNLESLTVIWSADSKGKVESVSVSATEKIEAKEQSEKKE